MLRVKKPKNSRHPSYLLWLALVWAMGLLGVGTRAMAADWGAAAASAVVSTEQVRVELLAHAPQGVQPGQPLWLGVQIQHQPGWHTYWKNPGDSGLPTQLHWTLPKGVQAGDMEWPLPQPIRIGNLLNYGYEGTVLLPVPLRVGANFRQDRLPVRLSAQWLVCRTVCIPQQGEFRLDIPAQGSSGLHRAAFAAALARVPQPWPQAKPHLQVDGQTLRLRVAGLPSAWQGRELSFFPEASGVFEAAAPWAQSWQGAVWTAHIPVSAQRSQSPQQLGFVLAAPGADTPSHRLQTPIRGTWPRVDTSAVPAALASALVAARSEPGPKPAPTAGASTKLVPDSAPRLSLWVALLGALAGGVLLNGMPCVFPVLAIKLLSLTQYAHPGHAARARRRGALAYCVGVVLGFIALGGLLLSLRAGGSLLGWGFQLQSPATVAALAVLFSLIALNLLGLLELPGMLPQRLLQLRARGALWDSALSGVLAVAVAAPCTAPFMGASLGLALVLPAPEALLIFASMGLGMALPFALLGLWPAALAWLPKPGAWMGQFRTAMAFPMLATVLWLAWIEGALCGLDGATALLGLLLLLSLAVWGWSQATQVPRPAGRLLWRVVAALPLAVGVLLLGPVVLKEQVPRPAVTLASEPALDAPDAWPAWSPDTLERLQAQGRTVFVDFTAAWCVTCQYNKKTVLANARVLQVFAEHRVARLRADWTRHDPAISVALQQLGRSGVPVYALYRPGQPPQLLSELPSVNELVQALQQTVQTTDQATVQADPAATIRP